MGSTEPFSQCTGVTGIFEGGMSSGGQSQPINLDGAEAESSHMGADSQGQDKGKNPSQSTQPINLKRKRASDDEYVVMLGMTEAVGKVAEALIAPQHNELHPDLYQSVMTTEGFSDESLMFALCYLLQHKAEGLCFVQMTKEHRVLCSSQTWPLIAVAPYILGGCLAD
jgi:hypothetical protein